MRLRPFPILALATLALLAAVVASGQISSVELVRAAASPAVGPAEASRESRPAAASWAAPSPAANPASEWRAYERPGGLVVYAPAHWIVSEPKAGEAGRAELSPAMAALLESSEPGTLFLAFGDGSFIASAYRTLPEEMTLEDLELLFGTAQNTGRQISTRRYTGAIGRVLVIDSLRAKQHEVPLRPAPRTAGVRTAGPQRPQTP